MPLLLRVGRYEFRKTLFRNKFFVKDLATGQVRYAGPEVLMKFNELVAAIKGSGLTVENKAFAVEYLAERFVATVISPNTLPAQMFLTGSAERFLSSVNFAVMEQLAAHLPPADQELGWTASLHAPASSGAHDKN